MLIALEIFEDKLELELQIIYFNFDQTRMINTAKQADVPIPATNFTAKCL